MLPNASGNYLPSALMEIEKNYPNAQYKVSIKNQIDDSSIHGSESHEFSIVFIVEKEKQAPQKVTYFINDISDLSESPEDAIIGRGLIDGNHLLDIFLLGYECGSKGLPLISNIKYNNPQIGD